MLSWVRSLEISCAFQWDNFILFFAFICYFFLPSCLSKILTVFFLFHQVKTHPEFSAPFVGKNYLFWLCDLLLAWDAALSPGGCEDGDVRHRPDEVIYLLLSNFLKDFIKGYSIFLTNCPLFWVGLAAGCGWMSCSSGRNPVASSPHRATGLL